MTIKIGDSQTGTPPVQGVYVVSVRWSNREMFSWWDGTDWSKPYLSAELCLGDIDPGLYPGRRLPRYKIGSRWNSVTAWRSYTAPPYFPVYADPGRNVVADALAKAMGG